VPERTVLVAAAEEISAPPVQQAEIMVHIAGAVVQPGVFALPYGSRVYDVLNLAGGATSEADLARINLAAFLTDAQQVIIPTEADEAEAVVSEAEPADGRININTADERLLATLPGIGPVLSANIVAHREAHGSFTSIEQLQNVPRIGAGIMNNIRELVTVE